MRVKNYLLLSLLLLSHWALAQTETITGKVTDSDTSEPLPGVSVLVKNTVRGTVTNVNGEFSLSASSNDILVFSFIGYETTEITVGKQTTIEVSLNTDTETLQEVVVVGYGSQKKKVVTGAISSVKASDLETLPVNTVGQSLQGRVSGLTIAASSGQPGDGATIRVRGITTLNNNDPLWVVDGVVVDNGGINYLNQSDIASIEVLKDAASQAIYGTRAAAGVILITTKSGQKGGFNVNYSGYYGISAPARKLDLLNATQYATLRNEASIAGGGSAVFADPSAFGEGTDWQEQIFNDDARRQNHEVSISGGNDVSTFYFSFGYLEQEGIVATDISEYKRINLRLNSTHKITDWLTVGENLGYAYNKSIGLGNTNSEYGGPLSSAINLDPITSVVVTDPSIANGAPYASNPVIRDAMGRPYGISTHVAQELTNPLAYTQTRLGNNNSGDNIVGNVFAEIEPIEGLKLRSTLGSKLAFYGHRNFTPEFYLNTTNINESANLNAENNRRFDYNIENTISYTKSIEDHNFSVLLGQGAYKENDVLTLNVTKANLPVDDYDDATLRYNVTTDDITASGNEGIIHTVSSLFARANYNYKEKYLFTGVIRRDGSSRFGANNKYGVFPSGSLGWIPSLENFWPTNNTVNFLKIRGGYGVVGNDRFDDFRYLSTISPGRNYTLGTGDASITGYSPDAPANPDLKWEETHQLNVGFEATLFNDFSLTFDWYKKETVDILRERPIPRYTGVIGYPYANIGDMENTGVELELGYRKQVGEVNFSVTGNVAYLQNKVTNLGDVEYINSTYAGFKGMSNIGRMQVGEEYNSFYGFEALGIFQTAEEVQNHTTNVEGNEVVVQPDAQPGDFIWADLNEDGEINDEGDRKFLGSPVPDWSYGINVKVDYRGFDLLLFGQGVAGNQIFQGLRRLDITNANYQTNALGRWTGPGTSNDFPRLTTDDVNRNFSRVSDFYLQDGDYFRMKVVQLGYTLPQALIDKVGMKTARVYVMAENLFTLTEYTGFDPEIGGGNFGVDRGYYPQARSFMVGVNVGF